MSRLMVTINPARIERATLRWAMERGVVLFRVNLGRHAFETNVRLIGDLHTLAARQGVSIQVLCDLPGPKARVGRLPGRIELAPGDVFDLREGPLSVSPWLLEHLTAGDRLDVGRRGLRLRVESTGGSSVVVEVGGRVRSNDGVLIVGRLAYCPDGLTPRDRTLLAQLADVGGVRWIAPSFVESPSTVAVIRSARQGVGVIAKIETQRGVDAMARIRAGADGLMFGRDDLSREVSLDGIDALIDQQPRGADAPTLTMAASGYFRDLSDHPTLPRSARERLARVVAAGVDVVISDETAYLECFEVIVKHAREVGIA